MCQQPVRRQSSNRAAAVSNRIVPIALGGINHWQPVLSLDAELVLSCLQVSLKCIHAADVEPHVLLQDTKTRIPAFHKQALFSGTLQRSIQSRFMYISQDINKVSDITHLQYNKYLYSYITSIQHPTDKSCLTPSTGVFPGEKTTLT